MERDKILQEFFKKYGILKAPKGFTSDVMNKIHEVPVIPKYKPLISKGVLIFIAVTLVLLLVISIYFLPESTNNTLFTLPNIEFKLPDISPLLSTSVAAGLMALFILLLSESRLRRS